MCKNSLDISKANKECKKSVTKLDITVIIESRKDELEIAKLKIKLPINCLKQETNFYHICII